MGLVARARSKKPVLAADEFPMGRSVTRLRSVNPNAAKKSMLCLAARYR
jgi:hypothetical protein